MLENALWCRVIARDIQEKVIDLLLEQDGSESRVETGDTLLLHDAAETTEETVGEAGLGDETDTGGLEGAEGNVGHELSAGGRGEVDSGAVVGGSLQTDLVDSLLLEELITTELEGTLEEVTSGSGTETGQEGASTLVLDDLAETTDHTTVVGNRVKLDTGLDAVAGEQTWSETAYTGGGSRLQLQLAHVRDLHIKRSDSAVGDTAAHGTSEGEAAVEGEARLGLVLGGSDGSHCEIIQVWRRGEGERRVARAGQALLGMMRGERKKRGRGRENCERPGMDGAAPSIPKTFRCPIISHSG